MAFIKFIGYYAKQWQIKDAIVLKPKDVFWKIINKGFDKLHSYQEKKNELREIEITIEYHYRKRTLDQNNLLWALYSIEANEMNAGMNGARDQMVTPEELYQNDLENYAPRIEIIIDEENLAAIKDEYKITNIIKQPENDQYRLEGILTSSKFNTKQMTEWIERIFNRMASNGIAVTNPAEIMDYWVKWRQHLNDNKIIIYDDLITAEQYKSRNPICEATGAYIGDGTGHLCHIKARGMGGNEEAEKNYASNWLHLCHEAHIEIQHKQGWARFLKLYGHLKYKVETALKRNYNEKK